MSLSVENSQVSQTLLDEERLLVERARRSPEAFGEVYNRYYARVYAYAYKRTRNPEDAEDIASETFALAFEGLARYEWRNVPFSAWLFRIASNRLAMHYRKLRPCQSLDGLLIEDADADPQWELVRASEAEEVRLAVSLLKKDQQRAVELRYNWGMRAREIASEMERTEGSVKLLLHRATNALRSQMLPLSA